VREPSACGGPPRAPSRVSRAAQLLWGILFAACSTPREPIRGATRNYVDRDGSSATEAAPPAPAHELGDATDAGAEADADARSTVVPIYGAAMVVAEAIRFDPNETELPHTSVATLEALREILHARRDLVLEIRGHADKRERRPQALSERRAQLVFDWFVRHDVSAVQLRLVGRGAELPAFGEDHWQHNARVEFSPLSWDGRD
jgi:outer membrane protein OmpA-like peptidoglycan-associated protein